MDPQGVHIYSIFKYGCRASSWPSAITLVCSSLELIGSRHLVIDQLYTYVTDGWKVNNHVTKESTAAMRTNFETKKRHVEKRMRKPIPKKSGAIINNLRKRGYLERDETLCRAVKDMETKGVSHNGCCCSVEGYAIGDLDP